MKKSAYYSGTLGILISVLSVTLFKIQHIEGGSILMVLGLVFNALVALPIIAYYLQQEKSPDRKLLLYGLFSCFILYAGVVSKLECWPASLEITAAGAVLFSVFVVLYSMNRYRGNGIA